MYAAFAAGFQPKPLAFQLADFGGRSGYWRLVFSKLQEEALKKKEEPPPAVKEVVETKPSPAAKPRVVKRRVTAPPPATHERLVLPVVIQKSIRTLFDDLASVTPLDARPVNIGFHAVGEKVVALEVQRTRRRRRQVEELLLLLAA